MRKITYEQFYFCYKQSTFHRAHLNYRPVPGSTQPPTQGVPSALSQEVKRPGCEADYSPPPIADVMNGSYNCTPQHFFIAWRLIS
jgi:hypothetical protein